MKTYTARCERDHDWWIVTVPELAGAFTQVHKLHHAGLTVRDIGTVLGVSHQRVDQLIHTKKPTARRAAVAR